MLTFFRPGSASFHLTAWHPAGCSRTQTHSLILTLIKK